MLFSSEAFWFSAILAWATIGLVHLAMWALRRIRTRRTLARVKNQVIELLPADAEHTVEVSLSDEQFLEGEYRTTTYHTNQYGHRVKRTVEVRRINEEESE